MIKPQRTQRRERKGREMNNSDANGFDITAESYQIIKNIGITVYLDNNNEKAILTLEKKLTNSIKLIIML